MSSVIPIEFEVVQVENPASHNLIFGQSHFIKTVEDIYEAVVSSSTAIKFGLAFCEASGPCLIRWDGNDADLIDLAKKNAMKVGCGHSFFLFLDGGFPINVTHSLKTVSEVIHLFCATTNPLQVVVAKSEQGRGVVSVIDGAAPKGFEGEKEQEERRAFLRKIGYKR